MNILISKKRVANGAKNMFKRGLCMSFFIRMLRRGSRKILCYSTVQNAQVCVYTCACMRVYMKTQVKSYIEKLYMWSDLKQKLVLCSTLVLERILQPTTVIDVYNYSEQEMVKFCFENQNYLVQNVFTGLK